MDRLFKSSRCNGSHDFTTPLAEVLGRPVGGYGLLGNIQSLENVVGSDVVGGVVLLVVEQNFAALLDDQSTAVLESVPGHVAANLFPTDLGIDEMGVIRTNCSQDGEITDAVHSFDKILDFELI
jgi:hypothetical protein